MVDGDGGARVPGDSLDELEEDSIVAAEAGAHSPKPRQAVRMEAASVVIADEGEPGPRETIPTGLEAYRPGDPTIVLRRMEAPIAPPKKKWLPWVIWGGAGALAFGLGGIIASMTAGDDADTGTAVPVVTSAAAAAAPEPVVQAPEPAVDPKPEGEEPGAAASAPVVLSPKQLPVDRPAARPASAPRAPAPAPAPASPQPKPKPAVDIPSGI